MNPWPIYITVILVNYARWVLSDSREVNYFPVPDIVEEQITFYNMNTIQCNLSASTNQEQSNNRAFF